MEGMLEANRNGHISCTHGGETLAGLISVRKQGILTGKETAIIDSTAHALKFSNFTNMYFENSIPYEYNITQNKKFINYPSLITPENQKEKIDTANIKNISSKIAANLGLKKR